MNRIFVLSFEVNTDRTGHIEYFFPKAEVKDYRDIIDGRNVFDQAVKNDTKHATSLKNWYSSRRWLHNWLSTRLSLFQRKL